LARASWSRCSFRTVPNIASTCVALKPIQLAVAFPPQAESLSETLVPALQSAERQLQSP
jgi:hypothetical protein